MSDTFILRELRDSFRASAVSGPMAEVVELFRKADQLDQVARVIVDQEREIESLKAELADERAGRALLAKATDRIAQLENDLAQRDRDIETWKERFALKESFDEGFILQLQEQLKQVTP